MTVKNFKQANYQASYISVVAEGIPYLDRAISDERLDDAEFLLGSVIDDAQDLLKFLQKTQKTQERRRKARSKKILAGRDDLQG